MDSYSNQYPCNKNSIVIHTTVSNIHCCKIARLLLMPFSFGIKYEKYSPKQTIRCVHYAKMSRFVKVDNGYKDSRHPPISHPLSRFSKFPLPERLKEAGVSE
jgi:hypothetical protein